jgi:hypothetical protein
MLKQSSMCYGCGKDGHKKEDQSCKAGKFDVHGSAPPDYKERMTKAKKKAEEKKSTAKEPGSSDGKAGGKDKKHSHAFNFGKGTCRYGAKCRFLHEKGNKGGKEKLPGFTPEQEKLVSMLLCVLGNEKNCNRHCKEI